MRWLKNQNVSWCGIEYIRIIELWVQPAVPANSAILKQKRELLLVSVAVVKETALN